MTFFHEPVQLAFFVQLLELVLQEHLLDLVPLCIDRAFAFGGPFFIDCFQPILGLPFLSMLLLFTGEGAFLDEHCLDRRDHVRIACFLMGQDRKTYLQTSKLTLLGWFGILIEYE